MIKTNRAGDPAKLNHSAAVAVSRCTAASCPGHADQPESDQRQQHADYGAGISFARRSGHWGHSVARDGRQQRLRHHGGADGGAVVAATRVKFYNNTLNNNNAFCTARRLFRITANLLRMWPIL
jgi:hypothetical protein